MIFSYFSKYWEILGFFTATLFPRLMVHIWHVARLVIKTIEAEQSGGVPFERMD